MGYIAEMLAEEQSRLLNARKSYAEDLQSCIKGAIVNKRIHGKEYPYLAYRVGDKVKTRYIKKGDLEKVRSDIEKRKRAETAIRNIDENLETIRYGIGRGIKSGDK